ncbi:hypothetical protein [Alteromonas macleodii]|uniref:Uncharacterized protein n=1 Tax=Alteromonas macleodii TaxID=28108 RepID=A0AB36FRQ5_ALTMA|nr:hypothetical protein [Alteromonas macleodii]OES23929.1 hypothetical protein BFV94_4977 [Alteromonas macleodii]OES24107.1 hypothetical protein BFV93_4860 [Alteromonas macleodii]OES25034.1 hypothetical protein BFV95_4502 [Alteromonas macleodii]OES38698.1 hypothetical protein BFV96_4809 [Alteromonas macleodii]
MNIEQQVARIKQRLNIARIVVGALALCSLVTAGSLTLFPDYLAPPTVQSDILFESETGVQQVQIEDIHWREFSSIPTFVDPTTEDAVDLVALYDTESSTGSGIPLDTMAGQMTQIMVDGMWLLMIPAFMFMVMGFVSQDWPKSFMGAMMLVFSANIESIFEALGAPVPVPASASISVPPSQHAFVLAQTGFQFESMDVVERYIAYVPINSLSTYEGKAQLIALENTVGLEGNKELRETHRIESKRRHDAQQTTLFFVRLTGSVFLIGFMLSSAIAFLILMNYRTLTRYIQPADKSPTKAAQAAKAA